MIAKENYSHHKRVKLCVAKKNRKKTWKQCRLVIGDREEKNYLVINELRYFEIGGYVL